MTPTDVSLAGAFLAGLVSFLSPCVLPLVPGYVSMLSGIGMEQLRQGEVPRSGLFSSALAFVAGFSVAMNTMEKPATNARAEEKSPERGTSPWRSCRLLHGVHRLWCFRERRRRVPQ